MPGNGFGSFFRINTWGESHGPAIGVVIDGMPPGIPLDVEIIQKDLDKRKPGKGGPAETARSEADRVEILSGTFEGLTTGTSISLLIKNKDAKSGAYAELADKFRPGHGDFTYFKRYGVRDYRGGGRASARETAARVAAGSVANQLLSRAGIEVVSFTRALGSVVAEDGSLENILKNKFFCPDMSAAVRMEELVRDVRSSGDSLGGIVETVATGVPAGLGDPVFDKLDGALAGALMSVGAVKGVEIGSGFRAASMRGSENNDPIAPTGFLSNNAGGILAGISNGEPIVTRVAVKPIPSISMEQNSVDINNKPVKLRIGGRHDASAIPRIVPVCQAMVRLVLVEHLLRFRAISGWDVAAAGS